MNNIWTIAKREYDTYFNSPLAYVVMLAILLPLGIFFTLILLFSSQNAMFGGGAAPDTLQINWLFVFLMVFLGPAITMRLISDEARMGTLELMLTAPIKDFEFVAGKWLGALMFVLSIAVVTIVFPIVLNNFVSPGIDWKTVISSYIGLILVSSAMLSLGVGISAIFNNQFAAFFVTLGLFFFLWFFVNMPVSLLQGGGEILNYLSLSYHFAQNINQGNMTLAGITYYLSLTALGLFIGTSAIEIRRWR
ncbi:MAG: ABC transporter permease subunit [Anaerolineales bacterium]|nr:ABC transporter permease subunit [Anaerolineales bacterium]